MNSKKNNTKPGSNDMLPSTTVMYRALARRDRSYEGIFFAGIRTTGVFCRPGCRARTPNRENVRFYASTKEALDAGFRPCKLCKPMEHAGRTPPDIQRLLGLLRADPMARIRDQQLRAMELQPAAVRRWFLKHHGITFQAYQRALRIGQAYGTIIRGEKVAAAAFDHGWGSLSGFGHSFKKQTGYSPTNGKTTAIIHLTRIPTPLGLMVAGTVEQGVCLLEFADRRMLETELKQLRTLLKAEIAPGDSPHFDRLQRELEEYFKGKRTDFTVPLVAPGSAFQQTVWRGLRAIPFGTTRSYGEQAKHLKLPAAVRAVARANGANRISILIPCHRVIGGDGKLVGYGGGLWRKRYLLELEQKSSSLKKDRP
ncbi:MAG TPA: methylated-DNA--[protein]-cysteine S-methyltransferase [Candidatus Edwardsbacteria bacterium]|nr:methylated-DNA--[protein]-cysteine S-methyltransferase [Candidatus Edwardsbacteria bacterium]